MKVILYMAMSINGIIARGNNEEDFLSHKNWLTFLDLAKETGCIIWGRKTQEVVSKWEKKYLDELAEIEKVVVSGDSNLDVGPGFRKVSSPSEAITILENNGFKETILSGGSKLNSSFAKEGLIDEILVNIEPIVIGSGIPLFSEYDFDLKLRVLEFKTFKDDLLQVRYKVQR